MLKIVEFIKANKNWKDLLTAPPYSLKIKENEDLILFNYSQIDSDPFEEITREARGLVLEKETWRVVRCGFYRFFNIGEAACDTISWETSTASIKHDGTLVFVYYYNGWRVGTRSTFDAEEASIIAGQYKNFRELFDDVAAQYELNITRLNPDNTYCMELCSQANRVVCDYPVPQLYHILTRNNKTLEEIDENIGIPKPAQYILENEQDYKDLVNSFDSNTEGIVIKDGENHRAKLKTLKYFELHRSVNNNNISIDYALDLIRSGEDSEFLSYFQNWIPFFEEIRKEWMELKEKVSLIQKKVNEWKGENPERGRKDFSKFVDEIAKTPVIWFKAYDGVAETWFETLPSKKLCKMFNVGGKR